MAYVVGFRRYDNVGFDEIVFNADAYNTGNVAGDEVEFYRDDNIVGTVAASTWAYIKEIPDAELGA